MAPKPTRFMGDVYPTFPDNDETKNVVLQVAGVSYDGSGDRHVLVSWSNGKDSEGASITQRIQLTGNPGWYEYYAPLATKGSAETNNIQRDEYFALGVYSRSQRDRILQLADNVDFSKTSVVNSCRTWTRDLLAAMVKEGLLFQDTFDEVDKGVPLKKRIPEV